MLESLNIIMVCVLVSVRSPCSPTEKLIDRETVTGEHWISKVGVGKLRGR